MGTTGTGRFTDYSGSGGGAPKSSGGGGGEERQPCDKPFSARLEEVDRCDYVNQQGSPPPPGTEVILSLDTRLTVSTTEGEVIGYLPTKFNYLASCIAEGREYGGHVKSSMVTPITRVEVDISPK